MSQRRLNIIGILLASFLSLLLIGCSENSQPTSVAVEKGGLINLAPEANATPQPTGPVEPTLAPTLPPSPTPLPSKAPTIPATPAATATPVPQTRGIIPRKIRIPAIKIDTFVEWVGVAKDGTMDVPKNIWNTAWFGDGGFRPGDPGNAVIAGHLDAPGTKAIFWDLDKLKPGDKIFLNDADNRELVFEVLNSQAYPLDNAPLALIFGPSSEAHLNLITCNGTFDKTSRNYNKRLIVFTRLIS
jgi:LPXTG-site transpeptidase (sortase) family protein